MTTSPMKIGLVGLDHWYSAFDIAQSLVERDDAVLAAIAHSDVERARSRAERFGVGRVTAQHDELLNDPSIELIASFISVDQNPAVCVAAAQNGKHLMSIKPFARTLDEGTEILNAVRSAGVVFFPMECQYRLSPLYRQLKSWIGEGRFGRILTTSVSQSASLPQRWPGATDGGWFLDADRAPGGGWIDHSIYHIDAFRWLLDDEVEQVSGVAGNLKYPELPMEDYGSATIRFKNGVLSTVEVTWLGIPQASRTTWSIVGTEGAVTMDSLTGRLSVAGNFEPFQGWVHTTYNRPADKIGHVVKVVRGEEAPVATVDDAWRNLAICRAFYQAAEAGTPVSPEALPA